METLRVMPRKLIWLAIACLFLYVGTTQVASANHGTYPSCTWQQSLSTDPWTPAPEGVWSSGIVYPDDGQGYYGWLTLYPNGASDCRQVWNGSALGAWSAAFGSVTIRVGPMVSSCSDPTWCTPPPNGRFVRQWECRYADGWVATTNVCDATPFVPAPPATLDIWTTPDSTTLNGNVTYKWQTTNMWECRIYRNGELIQWTSWGMPYSNMVGITEGPVTFEPWSYVLQCYGPSTGWVTDTATVTFRPQGVIDSVSSGPVSGAGACGLMSGWSIDGSSLSTALTNHMYLVSPWAGYNAGPTTVSRPDVNAVFGATGNHGYSYQLPMGNHGPGSYQVQLYPLGVNTSGIQDGNNPMVQQSGAFQCTPLTPASITATCASPGTNMTGSWPAASGADYYALRIDDTSTGGLDYQNNNYVGTSFGVYATTPGHTYNVWVHSCDTNGGCNWNTAASTNVTCMPSQTLTVTNNRSGTNAATSNPVGISCGADCSEAYAHNTNVTVTAPAVAGYSVAISNGCTANGAVGVGASCAVTMNAARTVAVNYTPTTYTVTYNANGATSGAAPGNQTKTHDVNLTLQNNTGNLARTGYTFAGWDTAADGSGADYAAGGVYAANAAVTLFARWTINQYVLTVSKAGAGQGTVSSNPAGVDCGLDCTHTYNFGQLVTLTAAAGANSTFAGWSGAGCSGTGTCTVLMNGAQNVTATFDVSTFPLTVSKNGTGAGTVTSVPAGVNCGAACANIPFNAGTVVTLTGTPTSGSILSDWTGEGCDGMGTCTVTLNQARNVTASFTAVSGTIDATPNSVDYNGTTSISWTSSGMGGLGCTVSGGGDSWNIDSVTSPQATSELTADTLYTLGCGSTAIASVNVQVDTDPDIGVADPRDRVVEAGSTITLTYDTNGHSGCSITGIGGVADGGSGNVNVTVNAETTYVISCTDDGSESRITIRILPRIFES